MTPGTLCDLYVLRQRYDDEQHGIKRERPEPVDRGIDWDHLEDAEEREE